MPAIQSTTNANGKSPKVEHATFRERVLKFAVHPSHKPKSWVILNMRFGEATKWVKAKIYNTMSNDGEQRELSDSWISKLYREMRDENFSPAVWCASVRKSHHEKLVYSSVDGVEYVEITVSSAHPLAHIDGNHRFEAMMKLIGQARKISEDKKSTDDQREVAGRVIEMVNSSDVTIQVFLDYRKVHENFTRLQAGRGISRNEQRIRSVRQRMLSKEKQPFADMAFAVTKNLATSNTGSHLYQRVTFGRSSSGFIGCDAMTGDSGSEMSCSIYGGAKIAKWGGMDAQWLEDCYVEAFKVIEDMTEAVQLPVTDGGKPEREVPNVLQQGKILCPLTSSYDGRKGGSMLIVGVGNMWAYYKLLAGRKQASEDDKVHLARCVDEVFDRCIRGGLNAPLKRQLMGEFASCLFEDFVLGEEETPKQGKVRGNQGVPVPLLDLIPPSAFAIAKQRKTVAVPDDDYDLDEFMGAEEEDEKEPNVEVSVRNRKALAKMDQG